MKPFEKYTVDKLWNDPYISKQMLQFHIDGSNDIASRKSETIRKTVDFLVNLLDLSPTCKVCDFGCGPGLYTNLFQKSGVITTGIDFSHNSVVYARETNPKVRYIEANYIEVDTKDTYDLITMIYCDFTVLAPDLVSKLLTNIYKHLNDGGTFFFDVHNMNLYNSLEEETRIAKETDGFYMPGECEIIEEQIKFEDDKVVLRHIQALGERKVELFNWFKCYTKEEITTILDNHGFEVLNFYSNTYGEQLEEKDSFTIECIKKSG
jgi:SAM-dependent methyltransferase